ENYLKLCKTLLDNNMSPGFAGVNFVSKTADEKGEYDFSKVEKVLDYCFTNGLNQFTMVQMRKGENTYSPAELENEFRFIGKYAEFLKKKGYLSKAVLELWDEPNAIHAPFVKERAERIKKINKDIRLQLFMNPTEEPFRFYEPEVCKKHGLYDLIDVWAPGSLVDAPHIKKEGKQVWCYVATMGRTDGPNFHIEAPATQQRLLPWFCWNAEVDGFEHWGVNFFWRNVKKGKPLSEKWPNKPWDSRSYVDFNGEGQLVYPGKDFEIYASQRLLIFRDGMDDYEYMKILKDLSISQKSKLSEFQQSKINQLLDLSHDFINQYPPSIQERMEKTVRCLGNNALIEARRKEIAQMIDEITKL
ncbi:MAG: DUF4091 domain-containing protein, partial [Leadbetterella sp.]